MADESHTSKENLASSNEESAESDGLEEEDAEEEIEIENDAPLLCRAHEREECAACGIDFREINTDLKRRRL